MIEFNRKSIRIWSILGMRRTIGAVLSELAELDDKFVTTYADSGRYFLYEEFKRNHPDRVIDLGISEQNVVAASAGLENEGFNVYAFAFGTFLSARALDQVRVNLGMMQIPVKMIAGAGGLADGNLSATHMSLEDVSNMRNIPGMTVIVPADACELVKVLLALMNYDKPAYVKLTGRINLPVVYKEDYNYEIGKAITLKEGNDIAIVANGIILRNVLDAAKDLEEAGISCKVINMHTVKPLDTDILREIAGMKLIVTVEEHAKSGGLGGAVAEFYAEEEIRPRQMIIAVGGDTYPDSGEYDDLVDKCGMSRGKLVDRIKDKWESL